LQNNLFLRFFTIHLQYPIEHYNNTITTLQKTKFTRFFTIRT